MQRFFKIYIFLKHFLWISKFLIRKKCIENRIFSPQKIKKKGQTNKSLSLIFIE